uniref:Uncharacterized protein n=1 Tax=Triticum urartu TaxID=4572 RepID=A0A8R7NYV3_TRIUA
APARGAGVRVAGWPIGRAPWQPSSSPLVSLLDASCDECSLLVRCGCLSRRFLDAFVSGAPVATGAAYKWFVAELVAGSKKIRKKSVPLVSWCGAKRAAVFWIPA